jgi:hypothetical protein
MANQILKPGAGMDGEEIDVKQKSLFARLKKLFAAGVVVRNVGGKKLKVKDTGDLMYATDRNSLRDRFNRVRSTSYNAYSRDFSLAYQAARIDLFRDYDTMDMDPIIASALDIYSDESLTVNEYGKVLVVNAEDDNIKGILTNLFYDILNIEHNLWSWTRNMCKYGDFYMRLYISPEYGVYQIEPISAYNVERLENTDPLNKNYVKFQIRPTDTSQVETLESFECAHFRLLSDSNFLPYGKSMIEGGRRVWKQLSLLEDAMLINRIMRAPERRIFKIDIGNIPPQEVDTFMEKMMTKTKKVPYVDQQTGDYNLRFNLMNMVEDFYLPVRGTDSGTSIETLSGIEWTGIDDVEYVRNKMMAALKIPKAFLGYEEELSGKATLASEDVRFARTIQRVQRIIISELEKIAIVHLYSQGYRDESLVNFKLELTNPSTIFEKEKIEVWGNKVDVASRMMEIKLFPKAWVYKNVFNLSVDDVEGLQDDVVEDSKQLYRFRSIEEEGNDPAQPFKKINPNAQPGQGGGMGGLPPPDMGGGMGGMGGGLDGSDLSGGLGGGMGGSSPIMETEKSDKNVVKELINQPDPMSPTDSEISEEHGVHSDEYKRTRDQTGEKKVERGETEDPLGHLEIKTALSTDRADRRLTDKTSKISPLSLQERKNRVATMKKGHIITSLEAYLSKNRGNEKKNLIKESEGSKSIMDPTVLLDQ